jgi:TonB family protein
MLGGLLIVVLAAGGGCATCPAPLQEPDPWFEPKNVDYRRRCEYFPPLPDGYDQARSTRFDVCVDPQGRVSQVDVKESSGDRKVDIFLARAVLRWTYEPRLQDGSPVPFCHPIVIRYKRMPRWEFASP